MKNTFQCKIDVTDTLTVEHTGSQQPHRIEIARTTPHGGIQSVFLTDKQARRLVDLLTSNLQINKGSPL
jgi:hypothetical protein